MQNFIYVAPSSTSEAFGILRAYEQSVAILAGGTDLINHLKSGKKLPQVVMQISKIKDLSSEIAQVSQGVRIGALTTLSQIAENELIKTQYTALAEAALVVGSKQIRNRATLVGNICNASPAADTVPALLLYDAVIHIVGCNGTTRVVPLALFIEGPGQTVLNKMEIVESIFIPYPEESYYSNYLKLSRRAGVDLATVGVASYVSDTGVAKLALGAVGPKAFRAETAEKWLHNNGLDIHSIKDAGKLAAQEASPISDLRASREYRLAMIEVMVAQALKQSMEKWGIGRKCDEFK